MLQFVSFEIFAQSNKIVVSLGEGVLKSVISIGVMISLSVLIL